MIGRVGSHARSCESVGFASGECRGHTEATFIWTAVVMDDDSPVRDHNRWSESICSGHVPQWMNSSVAFYGKQAMFAING